MTVAFPKVAQTQEFNLAGSGIIAGSTSLVLKSFTKIDGTLLAMSDFGSIGYGTLEPSNNTQEEQISFTGVTQNLSNGTCTLTGVSSISFTTPYSSTTGVTKTHAGATTFVISNTSGFYNNVNAYIDQIAVAGGVPATTSTLGLTKLSCTPVDSANPIVLGQNDLTVAIRRFGGTGADGALSFSSGTQNIDLAGAQVVVKNYTLISITGTGALTFTNPHANGTIIVIKSQGNVTISSSTNPAIDIRGLGGNSSVYGNTNLFFNSNPGTNGANNYNSSPGAGGVGGVKFSNSAVFYRDVLLSTGAGGGNSGGYDGSGFLSWSGGGGGGGASAINTGTNGTTGGYIGTGNVSTISSGGRGGGALYIECYGSYSVSSTLNAAGSNGLVTSYSGSGGGGGGCIFVLYNTLTSNTGTYTVTGGTGGSGGGSTGGNGGNGYSYVGLNTEFS